MILSLGYSILIIFLFSYFSFSYLLHILIETKVKWYLPFSVSIFNTCIFFVCLFYKMSPLLYNYLFFFIVTVEFLFFLKGKILQSLFSSGYIMVHTSSICMICSSLHAFFLHKLPYEIYNTPNLQFINIGIIFSVVLLVLFIEWKMIPGEGVKKVSSSTIYAMMISIIEVYIVFYSAIDFMLVLTNQYFSNLYVTGVSTSILTMILFYILLLYSINSAKLIEYKNKTLELENTKNENLKYQETLKDKIIKDGLTSCYNRNFIMNVLQNNFECGIADFMVIFLDLNGLKYVNDNFGHNVGDKYISGVSQAMLSAVRSGDYVSRIGGDEFLIVLMNLKENEANAIIKRIDQNIKYLDEMTEEYKVAISKGHVYVDSEMLKIGISKIIQLADQKMFQEKKKYYDGGW